MRLGRTPPRFNCSSQIGGGCCSATKSCRTASPWTAARKASLHITVSWTWLRFMSIELVMLSNHLILCCPLLLLPSIFPSISIFSNESALHIRWPKDWSISFSPSNEYSELISFRIDLQSKGLISLQSKGFSRVFSSTTVWKHQFFSTFNFLLGPIPTYVHDYWKNHSFGCMVLCWQSDVSAF